MAIYVKKNIYGYWVLADDESVTLANDDDTGLIVEYDPFEYDAYVKTKEGADLLRHINYSPFFLLDSDNNVILEDDETGIFTNYNGFINKMPAFAIYSEDDNSLIFYCLQGTAYRNLPNIEDEYNNRVVTKIYTNFLDTDYEEANPPKWHEIAELVKSVSFDESFARVKPKYVSYWFYEMKNCISIDTENLDTSLVTDMHDTFSGLESLEELNVNDLDVRNVTSMYGVFYDCSKLTTIDISNWQTDSLTDVHGMFDSCSGLTHIDLSSLNTSKVTDMRRLFYMCTSLQEIDVSTLDTSNVEIMREMFYECTSLTTIYSDDDVFVTTSVTNGGAMFTNDINLVGGVGTTYSSSLVDVSYAHIDTSSNPGYFTNILGTPFAVYSADDNSLTFYRDKKTPTTGEKYNGKTVTSVYKGFDTDEYTSNTSVPWYSYSSDIKSVSFDSSFESVKPISTAFWFSYMSNCESIDLTYLDTSSVTPMQQMFRDCTSLTSLDLSMFNMNKVERIANMCLNDSNLKTIDLCGWETGSILYMASVFMNCTSLTTIYADRDFKISSDLQNDAEMFTDCTSLVGGNGTKYDSSKVDSSMAHIDTSSNPGYFTAK